MTDGVRYYEAGFPDILRPSSDAVFTGRHVTPFFTYFIHYDVAKVGEDPISASATDFVLLNHYELDSEVAEHLSVKMHLPLDQCVNGNFSSGGRITLDNEQVNTVKDFNTALFRLVLGKGPISSGQTIVAVANQTKGYYVMPLKGDRGVNPLLPTIELIDWLLASNLQKCELDFKGQKYSQSIQKALFEINSCNEEDRVWHTGSLRLKFGDCKVEDLEDAVVTYGPWSTLCFIAGIANELCGLSIISGHDDYTTHADLWMKRYGTELKHVSQPLLVGYRLSRASNFLRQPPKITGMAGYYCKAKARRVELPPEVCILHVGIKGCLIRGALRLPSVLHALENCLLAVQLRDGIGVPLSVFKVQECLTSRACNSDSSYDRLELLGDSFLTFVGAAELYFKHLSMDRDSLASSLHSLVENKRLFQCAEACGLPPFVFADAFQVRDWIPPGPIPDCSEADGMREHLEFSRRQRISYRTLADVVEALVGSYILNGSIKDALKAMSWLKIPIEYPLSITESVFGLSTKNVAKRTSLASIKRSEVEKRLKYHFRNPDLLDVALQYDPEESESGLDISRLGYLGDCILSYFVTRHLIAKYWWLNVGYINAMKQSIINKENYSCKSVKHDLHLFLQGISSSVRDSISVYASTVHRFSRANSMPFAYGIPGQCAPKILGDIIPSLAATVFLDSGLDAEIVWKVFQPLLEPLPTPGCFPMHPINELVQLCEREHLSLDIQCAVIFGIFQVEVKVNQDVIASSQHAEKRTARKFAAVKALQQLCLEKSSIRE